MPVKVQKLPQSDVNVLVDLAAIFAMERLVKDGDDEDAAETLANCIKHQRARDKKGDKK